MVKLGEEFNYDLYSELLDKCCPLTVEQLSDVFIVITQIFVASEHSATVKQLLSFSLASRRIYMGISED